MGDNTQNPTVDNMNRQVDVMSYGPDAQSFIKDMMMGDVKEKGKPPGHSDKEDKGQYKKLEKVLEDIEESFSGILKDAEKSAKKIGEIYKKVSGSKAAPSGGKTKANIKAEFDGDDAEEGIEKLGDSAEGFGSRVTESLGKISPATQEAAWHLRFLFNKVGQTMQKATSMMVGGIAAVTGGLTLGHVFEGLVGPTIQFERSMRRTLHQTQGVGKSVVFMQEELTKVGETTHFTGRMRHKFLKAYDANMKKGIRTQKETLKITRTGLGLANLIGDSTDSTAESMHDWSMQTGMTTQQVGALSYKIRDVAKMTGVTGENLANVVKQSAAMVTNFRNAGSFSVAIAGNIVAMNAAASKHGAEDFVSEFQKGLSGIDGWTNSSMRSLLAISATASGMKFNVLDLPDLLEDPGKTKKLLTGMETQLLGLAGSARSFEGGNKLAAKSLEEMSSGDYLKRMRAMSEANPASGAIEGFAVLDAKMRKISGKGIGENAVGLTALKESFQTIGQRMDSLNDKYKGNLSIEEARLYKEQQLETVLMSQISSLSDVGATQDPFEQMAIKLGAMDDASLKHMGVSDQLIAQTQAQGKSMKDLMGLKFDPETGETKFIKSAGSMEAMGGVMQSMSDNVVEKMKQANMSASEIAEFANIDIEKAMSGDRGEMMNFMDKAQAAEQAAAAELQSNVDPISDMAKDMMEVNDKMGKLVQNSSQWFMRVFGKLGIIALLLGGAVAGIVKGFGVVGLTSWIPGIKKAVGRGGADAAKMRGVASGLQGIPGKITRAITGTNVKVGGQIIPNALGGGRQAAGASKMVGGLAGKLKSLGGGKSLITKIPGVGKALTSVGTRLASIGASAGLASTGANAATTGLGAVLTPLKAIPGIGLAVTAALGGVIGAFSTGAKAADLYGTTQEQLTFNQKYAAEEAGFLTGALNMLSFGVFAKWLGPGGTWTKGLARFFAALGPLRYVIVGILVPIRVLINALKVVWGVIKGIGVFIAEVFKGIWSGIKIALSPFMELGQFIMSIGSSIAGMLGQNAEGPSLLSKIGDVTEWIVGAFRILGKVVGWVAKAIGWLIKIALYPLMMGLKLVATVIGGVIKGVILFTKAILKPFEQVWSAIKSIFVTILEPFVAIWNSIKELFGAIGGIFGSTGDSGSFFMAIMDGIAKAFEWVGKIIGWVLNIALKPLVWAFKIIGFAIKVILSPLIFLAKAIGSIAKLIKGEINFGEFMSEIGSALMELPKLIWSGLVAGFKFLFSELPTMIYTGLLSIPKMIYGFVGRMFSSLGLDKVAKYFSAVSKVFGSLINIVKAIFTLNFSALWDGIKGLGGAIWDVIKSIPGMLWEVFTLIPSLLWKGFKFLLQIPKLILTGLLSIPKMLYGFVGKMFNKLGLKKIGSFFGKVSKVFGSLINIVKAIFTLNFSALWDGIKGLGVALWGVIKSIPGMIWQVVTLIPSLLWKGIKGLGGLIWKGIKALPGLLLKGLKWALVGIVAVFVGIPALIVYGLAKAISWLVKTIWKGLKGIGKFLLKLPGYLWSGIKTVTKWLFKAMTFIPVLVWVGIKKLMGFLWSSVKAVGKFIIGIPGMLLRGILSIPLKIWEGIKWLGGKLADFFSWIWDGVKKLPGMIWDGIVSVFAALPGFMLDAIIWVGEAFLKTLKWALIGIAAVLVGIPALIVYGLYKAISWLAKMVWKGIKGLVKFIMKVPGMLWSGFKWVVKALFKAMTFIPIMIWNAVKGMMKWLWGGVKKLGGLLWDGVKKTGEVLTYIPRKIWQGLKWVYGKLKKGLGWIWGKIKSFFGWMWESFKSVGKFLLELPGKIWDGIKAAAKAVFVDFPIWLWNGFKTALTKVWDWIKSWVPDWMKGEEKEERAERLNPSGEGGIQGAAEYVANARMGHGAAQMWHGETFGEKAAGAGEALVGAVTLPTRAAIGAVKTVGGWISSGWDWLTGKEGISSVKKGGLALIHAGEMVVPAGQSLLDGGAKLSAQGTEGRAGVGSAISGMWDSIRGFFGRGMETAKSAISKLGQGDILGAAGDVASGAWDSIGDIAGMMNPLNWFGGGGGKKESDIVKIPKITPLEAISTDVTAIADNTAMIGMLLESRLPGDGLALPSSLPDRLRGTDLTAVGSLGGSDTMMTGKAATGGIWSSIKGFFGRGMDSAKSAMSKLGQGDILGAAGDIGGGMLGSLKSIFSGIFGGEKAQTSGGFSSGVTNAGILSPAALAAEKSLSMVALAGVDPFGNPGLGETGQAISAMSAVLPTADIHDRVQRDIATSRSSTSVGGKELSMISSSTDQQCATLVEIRDHLKAMRDNMGQTDTSSGYSSPTADGGDTSSNIQPKSSPNYYTWQFGQHGQIGNKQVINPGT